MMRAYMVFLVICLLLHTSAYSQDKDSALESPKFQSAHACKACHGQDSLGNQLGIWEQSLHSQAYRMLIDKDYVASAREAGMDPLPGDNPRCLACHAPLHDKASELKMEGVTCEACHQPIAEGHQKKKKVKAWCLTCHENAHDKTFDFSSAWKKIKHAIPKKE
jgi:hypothetical protein